MLAIASAQAGVVPAVVDVSSTAWGSHAWGAPAWGAHSWGAPAWGAAPWASPLALPSLTTWGSPLSPWGVGPLGVHGAPALSHGHGHDG